MQRTDFLDPLYEYMDLNPAKYGVTQPGFDLNPYIQTHEFARQAFLHQNNFGFLVFPSSTHTRFAHALGSCYLGLRALESIHVWDFKQQDEPNIVTLGTFLASYDYSREFLLSLLLHDIGHFPFSHVLEACESIRELPGEQGGSHEQAATEFILGSGRFYQAFTDLLGDFAQGQGAQRLHTVLAREFAGDQHAAARLHSICFVITGQHQHLEQALVRTDGALQNPDEHRAILWLLHALVSGVLDLDRVDHYRRDSHYFNGQGSSINYLGLLNGISILFSPTGNAKKGIKNGKIVLTGQANGQALALLNVKKRLREDIFEDSRLLAYEAMLHEAADLSVGDHFNRLPNLLVLTDEQLLESLAKDEHPMVRALACRIRYRMPYPLIGRFALKESKADWSCVAAFKREITACFDGLGLGNLLCMPSKLLRKKLIQQANPLSPLDELAPINPGKEWLDMDNVFFSAAPSVGAVSERELMQSSRAKGRWYKDIKALQEHNLTEQLQFWLFCENALDDQSIRHAIKQMKNRFGLRTEEGLA